MGSDKKRQKIIDQFQEDPSKRVIIIISLSGATGTTLTAAARMRVVEMDWLPANMIQIEDRIWRIGQLQNVDIGYLFIPESMDVKLGNLIIERMVSEEASLNTIKKIEKPGKTTKAGGLLSDDTLGAKPKAPPNKTETKTAKTARQPARQDTEAQAQPDLFQI